MADKGDTVSRMECTVVERKLFTDMRSVTDREAS